MNRAIRYIRSHAKDYGIDPDRIGIMGASAGGHLSLMQGCAWQPGNPTAKDPVDRVSSKANAVGCFFPPTDFLNYGKEGELAIGTGVLKDFWAPFDFHTFDGKRGFVPVTDMEKRKNVVCKISGIIASVKRDAWSAEDLAPIIEHCAEAFGKDRLIFASDWPMCTLTASYKLWVEALQSIVRSWSEQDQRKLFHDNAVRVYGLA